MKKNLLIIGSNIHNAVGHEWVVEKLDKDKFNIHFILLNKKESVLERFLLKHPDCKFLRIQYDSKKNLFRSFITIYKYLKKNKIDIVHTHLIDASLVGLFAAKLAGIKKRIHTRHHSDFHHKYHRHAVSYDKIINKLSTHIIAVTSKVKHILVNKENVSSKKITVVNHGFDIKALNQINNNEITEIKNKYNLKSSLIIGCISRYTYWKGIQYIIPAFKKILNTHPDAILVLANASGSYKNEIQKLLESIPKENYREIIFEDKVNVLYKTFNLFIHTPIDTSCEAYGQIYIEALALRIPSIFTVSGVANDFSLNEVNCIIVEHENTNEIYHGMLTILNNKDIRERIIEGGYNLVSKEYTIEKMVTKLENIYRL